MNWNIIANSGFPQYPDGGKIYIVFDGQWKNLAFHHIDHTTGKHWWEGLDSATLLNITHWMLAPEDPKI